MREPLMFKRMSVRETFTETEGREGAHRGRVVGDIKHVRGTRGPRASQNDYVILYWLSRDYHFEEVFNLAVWNALSCTLSQYAWKW